MHQPQATDAASPDKIAGERPILTTTESDRLRHDLAELRRVRDRDLPGLLRDARTFVASDATEEILQIQDDFVFVERRIAQIERLLDDAQVISDTWLAEDLAAPGRTVNVRYSRTGKLATYRLSGTGGLGSQTVSLRSPIGQALLGRSVGDVVVVDLPRGRAEELEILSIRPSQPEAGT